MKDLISQLRAEFSTDQLVRYANLFCNWILTAPLGYTSQYFCTKTLFALLDPTVQKVQKEQASALCTMISETSVEKIRSLDLTYQAVLTRLEKRSDEKDADASNRLDITYIEKDRPFSTAFYAIENPETAINGMCLAHS